MKKMKKKYQIFISSTYLDLIKEREIAVESIVKMGHIPAGMELFKAGKSQWQTITKWIDDSDIYVLILGGRYGSINKNEGKSYTHLEYEYALSQGKPTFALVLSDKFIKIKEKKDSSIIEKENKEKYSAFKELVLSKIVKHIDDIRDIKIELPENIRELEDTCVLEGWSKGDLVKDSFRYMEKYISLLEVNQMLKNENEKLLNKIEKLNTEKKKVVFKSGLTYLELKNIFEEEKIEIPNNLNKRKDKNRSLLMLFIEKNSILSKGINNRSGASEVQIFLFYELASRIVGYGLANSKKAPGYATWSTITLNDEGKKFYTLLKKEQINNQNK